MPKEYMTTLLVVLGAAVLFIIIIINRKKTFSKLNKALNISGSPAEFNALLENKFVKATLSTKELLILKLDGSIASGDTAATRRAIKQLDTVLFGKRDRITYYQKRLSFFASLKEADQAEKSYKMLSDSVELAGSRPEDLQLLENSRLMLDVFVLRDTAVIPKLESAISSAADSPARGVNHYLLARLYYAAGRKADAAAQLDKALALLVKTPWESEVRAAIADNSELIK